MPVEAHSASRKVVSPTTCGSRENSYSSKPPKSILKYIFWSGAEEVEIKVHQSGKTKQYARHNKFQITSAGYDGKPGTDDDIKPW